MSNTIEITRGRNTILEIGATISLRQITVQDDGVDVSTNVTVIDFANNLDVALDPSGKVIVTGQSGGGGGGAIDYWDPTKADYVTNDQVAYQGNVWRVTVNNPTPGIPPGTNSDFEFHTPANDSEVPLNFTVDNGAYKDSENVSDMARLVMLENSGRYRADTVDSSLYIPNVSYVFPERFTNELVGVVNANPPGVNELGCYVIQLDNTGIDINTIEQGDFIALAQDASLPNGVEPPDRDDWFTVDAVYTSINVIVLNRQISRLGGYPAANGWYVYRSTFDYRQADGSLPINLPDNSEIKFTGTGMVGYPFPKKIVQPNEIVKSENILNNIVWAHEGRGNFAALYGIDSVDSDRPTGFVSKLNTLELVFEQLTHFYAGFRTIMSLTPRPMDSILIEDRPVTTIYAVLNRYPIDLSQYPNSWIQYNVNNSGFDVIGVYSNFGQIPKLGDELPEPFELCTVFVESNEIQNISENIWLSDNGSREEAAQSKPQVNSGALVIDNNLSTPIENTRYTLTNSIVATDKLESIETVYPSDVGIYEVWPDFDNRIKTEFKRDFRYYNDNATVPDPEEPNPKHALIPFGSFAVDFLYMYQKNDGLYDLLIYKGNRLYTAGELQAGVDIVSSGVPSEVDTYLPIAALVQYGSGELFYHQIIDIRNISKTANIKIQVPELLEDLSSKTQFRSLGNTITKQQYSPFLEGGAPEPQGWTSVGLVSPEIDTEDGLASLNFEYGTGAANYINRPFPRPILENLYNNGGADNFKVRAVDVGGYGEAGFRVLAIDDPRSTRTVFVTSKDNSFADPTYAAHNQSVNGPLLVEDDGYFEFTLNYFSISSNSAILSSSDGLFVLKFQFGSQINIVYNGAEVSTGFNVSSANEGDVLRFQRSGSVLEYYIDNVLSGSVTLPNAQTYNIDRLYVQDDGGSFDIPGQQIGITNLSFKQNASSAVKTFQMGTRQDRFDADVADDGYFQIFKYNVADWKADPTEPGVAEQAFKMTFESDGVNTTFTVIADAGNRQIVFNETGYFDVSFSFKEASGGDWGTADLIITSPTDVSQTENNITWNYSGYSDFDLDSWNRIGAALQLGETQGKEFYLRDYDFSIFTGPATINLTADDFQSNNILYIEGSRNWTFVVPPFSSNTNELNSPDKSTVYFELIGSGSYRVKRPDLSTDILVNRGVSVQFAYTDFTSGSITCDDDIATVGYVNYSVADYLAGDSAIILPPPTEAIDVSYDNTGTDITATNVQAAITEIDARAGAQFSSFSETVAAGDVYNTPGVNIPTDYITNGAIQFQFNGVGLDKGSEVIRENSSSVRLTYDSVAGKHRLTVLSLPGAII